MSPINLSLTLHNHQPVGNFDWVFEEVCLKAYEPLLKIMERYPDIKLVLHYSGGLLEWIRTNKPNVFERIHSMVRTGQVELLGGGFYEPILVMLPERDRLGQIRSYTKWLKDNLGAEARGVWLAERVWEQPLVSSLREAGVEYTVVDDSHFRHAGLDEEELDGYFLTEDEGEILKIFPGSERLRYCIPFEHPEKTIEYLRQVAHRRDNALVVYADDGEKFGSWPKTYKHVYEDGWLEQFLQTLRKNRDWIRIITFKEAVEKLPPRGKVYLPDASYREMMEWALPTRTLLEYEEVSRAIANQPWGPMARRFLKGGSWRNFRVKYQEAYQMYARMLEVSRRVAAMNKSSKASRQAQKELYQAQCNDSYWHGIFGGLYLPHLRSAVYQHLLKAETLCTAGNGTATRRGVHAEVGDFDLDTIEEFKLTNPRLSAYFKPDRGGHLYELDYKPKGLNLLNTLSRREEAYHKKILQAQPGANPEGVKSIHEVVPEIEEGLKARLQYDSYLREGLIDHLLSPQASIEDCLRGRLSQLGDSLTAPYQCQLEEGRGKVSLKLQRSCNLQGERDSLLIKKQVDLDSLTAALNINYNLVNTSKREIICAFGVEFNFAMSAGEAEGRYYLLLMDKEERAGHLAMKGSFSQRKNASLVDENLGLKVTLEWDKAAELWLLPLLTVSQSEAGFEKVYQGSTVLPLWHLSMKPGDQWDLRIKTSLEEI
ncbi:MAG TPA: alpha-amylase/4-alpha-glucanotransferase domain-containing protein [Candidatus Hypogeohydataceae bacterium YC41]